MCANVFNACSGHNFSFLLMQFSENNNLLSKATEINLLLFTVYCISCCFWVLRCLCQFLNLNYFNSDVRHSKLWTILPFIRRNFTSENWEELNHRGDWNCASLLGILRHLIYWKTCLTNWESGFLSLSDVGWHFEKLSLAVVRSSVNSFVRLIVTVKLSVHSRFPGSDITSQTSQNNGLIQ